MDASYQISLWWLRTSAESEPNDGLLVTDIGIYGVGVHEVAPAKLVIGLDRRTSYENKTNLVDILV